MLEAPEWMKRAAAVAEIADGAEVDRLDIEPQEPEPSFVGVAGVDPEGCGPVLVAYVDPPAPYEPEALDGPQAVLPMPDAGPLFAGPKRGRP